MNNKNIRVLVAKVGLDGHDRGAKFVARVLKDSGMEVIYTGLRQTVEVVVNTCIQEDVDVLGLSFHSGDHMTYVPKIIKELKQKGKENITVVLGGTILKHHIPELIKMGVHQVFLSGSQPEEIIKVLRESVSQQEKNSVLGDNTK